jgi:putative SOS response-associated peptidase YedK
MCGRFTNKLTWEELVRLYRLTINVPPHNLPPGYNICPTDPVDVVTEHEGDREFTRVRWGLVPAWWPKPLKDLKAATFNARAETVAEKPFFREAFRRTRCLIKRPYSSSRAIQLTIPQARQRKISNVGWSNFGQAR